MLLFKIGSQQQHFSCIFDHHFCYRASVSCVSIHSKCTKKSFWLLVKTKDLSNSVLKTSQPNWHLCLNLCPMMHFSCIFRTKKYQDSLSHSHSLCKYWTLRSTTPQKMFSYYNRRKLFKLKDGKSKKIASDELSRKITLMELHTKVHNGVEIFLTNIFWGAVDLSVQYLKIKNANSEGFSTILKYLC